MGGVQTEIAAIFGKGLPITLKTNMFIYFLLARKYPQLACCIFRTVHYKILSICDLNIQFLRSLKNGTVLSFSWLCQWFSSQNHRPFSAQPLKSCNPEWLRCCDLTLHPLHCLHNAKEKTPAGCCGPTAASLAPVRGGKQSKLHLCIQLNKRS